MTKEEETKPNWDRIMADETLCRLAKRINRHFLYMSEEDIQYLFDVFYDANRIMLQKSKTKKEV